MAFESLGRDCNGTKEEIMFIKIILIILTIIAYTVFIMPAYFEMQENIKGLEYKNIISESSNHILRKENEILKRKINKLETE